MRKLLLFFICELILHNSQAGTLEDGIALNGNLSVGYNKNVRPLKNQTQALVVDIMLYVGALQEFDEVLERFSLVTVLSLSWTDERLTWNSSDYGEISTTFFGYKEVWVPELILTNPSEKIDSFGKDWHRIRYRSDGKAAWKPGSLVHATCSVNAYYFPFDIQECFLDLFVFGYYASEVRFNANNNAVDISFMPKHGTWNVIGTSVKVGTEGGTSNVRYYFRLERRPQYLIINVIMPILFLNLLNVLVFLLPAESGERVSYSITVLLSIAVFMTIVSDTLPRTSEPMPLISYALLGSLFLSSYITVVTVLNLRLFYKKEDDDVPIWLIKVYRSLKRLGCRRGCGKQKVQDIGLKNDHVTFHHDNKTNHMISNSTVMSNKETSMHENCKDTTDPDDVQADPPSVTWQDVSGTIDYICLGVSTTVTLLSSVLFVTVSKALSK